MTLQEPEIRPGISNKARELMEAINTDAGKDNIWVRTQMNAPSQRAWFADPSGTGTKGTGRVAIGQMKSAPYRWRWKEYKAYLDRLARIAAEADVPPIEFADRQSILLTNPGLGGRLQVTNTIRCAISIYNPGDIAPAHVHSPNASRTILSSQGRLHQCRRRALRSQPRRHHPDAERHLARPRQRGQGAGDLDRHARLAADGVPGLRLGRSGVQAGHRQQSEEPGHDPDQRLLRGALRQRRPGSDLRLASAWLGPRTRALHPLPRRSDPLGAGAAAQGGRRSARRHPDAAREPGDRQAGASDAQLSGAAPASRRRDAAQARDLRHLPSW